MCFRGDSSDCSTRRCTITSVRPYNKMELFIFLILCIYIVHNAYIKRIVESFWLTFSIFPIYRARNLPWQGDFAPKLIKTHLESLSSEMQFFSIIFVVNPPFSFFITKAYVILDKMTSHMYGLVLLVPCRLVICMEAYFYNSAKKGYFGLFGTYFKLSTAQLGLKIALFLLKPYIFVKFIITYA